MSSSQLGFDRMKKYIYGFTVTAVALAAALCIVAARRLPTVRANTYIGTVSLGGLSKDEAQRQIRVWWEDQKLVKLEFHLQNSDKKIEARTPGKLGITIDDEATAASLPMNDLAADIQGVTGGQSEKLVVPAIFKSTNQDLTPFGLEVRKAEAPAKPAKVLIENGAILKTHESASESIDWPKLLVAVNQAMKDKTPVEIPLKVGAKHVTDQDLDQIDGVVSQFTTHFPSSNRPRCSNIKLASEKLKGVVLLPGERLSFNGTVGRRTVKAGFKLAGVYKNGQHDVGIGGGICQVSTTLYNASLFADLKIKQRSNHSLPVAYVPLGRDATVDYGSLDLVVENPYKTPIAVDSHYTPGRLTFTIMGKKDPSLTVKVQQSDVESWDCDTSTYVDHHLRPGSRRIVKPGSRGHAVSSFRLVYRDGKLIRKDHLGRCTYGGQPRVVAVGPAAPKIAPTVAPVPTAPVTAPPTTVGG